MQSPTWVALLCLAVGAIGVVRAAVIVAAGADGRFRLDPWLSLTTGFALALLGQQLLAR